MTSEPTNDAPIVTLDWDDLAVAFLHDPPDKALAIRGHVARAERYLEAAGLTKAGSGRSDDQLAAILERFPMPSGYRRAAGWEGISVGPEPLEGHDAALRVVHPLAGTWRTLPVDAVDETKIRQAIETVVAGAGGKTRWLRLWRLLPEALVQIDPAYAHMPADTRSPDHTIWHHADITAALHAAGVGRVGAGGPAFLSLAIGPVQTWIAAARSVRDLWAGSYLLSRLMFAALEPLIDMLGPQSVVFPYLRGNPLLDLRLRDQHGIDCNPSQEALLSPSLPHRALAIVPAKHAHALADCCAEAVRAAWLEIAGKVRTLLCNTLAFTDTELEGWALQIEHAFDVRAVVLPWQEDGKPIDDRLAKLLGGRFDEVFPDAAEVRRLASAIPESDRPGYRQDQAGRWQLLSSGVAACLSAARSVRHVPAHATPDDTRFKCTIFGSYEAMGPKSAHFERFWDEVSQRGGIRGIHVREGERLSAVALVKRFCPVVFCEEFGVDPSHVRFADTATIAARDWLERAGIDPEHERRHEGWSGQWLHRARRKSTTRRDTEPVPDAVWTRIRGARHRMGPAPTYLAALHFDGDRIGKWLRGACNPRVRDVIHPTLRAYFEGLEDPQAKTIVERAFTARRPTGPTIHAAISEALGVFSLLVVPLIVREANGELIYAGGDDVLALLPLASALRCAHRIRQAFSGQLGDGPWAAKEQGYICPGGRERLTMGPNATGSAGLVVFHHKDDLRAVLGAARAAEAAAKDAGRDRLGLSVRRRSGEHANTVLPWSALPAVEGLREAFEGGLERAVDRWAYRLREVAPTLEALPREAVYAEISRLIDRTEERGERRFLMRQHAIDLAQTTLEAHGGAVVENYAKLVQSAAFMARGRDDR